MWFPVCFPLVLLADLWYGFIIWMRVMGDSSFPTHLLYQPKSFLCLLKGFIPFGITGKCAHMGIGKAYSWMSCQFIAGPYVSNCGCSTLLNGTSAVLWGLFWHLLRPEHVPCFVCSGALMKNLLFSALFPTDWAITATVIYFSLVYVLMFVDIPLHLAQFTYSQDWQEAGSSTLHKYWGIKCSEIETLCTAQIMIVRNALWPN